MSSDWPTIDASVNAIMQAAFGEPVVYQSVQAGMPVGVPVTITAIRRSRVREEAGPFANLEEIDVNPNDLAATPQRGDWVTAWGTQFVVTTVRQPDPNGMITWRLWCGPGRRWVADGRQYQDPRQRVCGRSANLPEPGEGARRRTPSP